MATPHPDLYNHRGPHQELIIETDRSKMTHGWGLLMMIMMMKMTMMMETETSETYQR